MAQTIFPSITPQAYHCSLIALRAAKTHTDRHLQLNHHHLSSCRLWSPHPSISVFSHCPRKPFLKVFLWFNMWKLTRPPAHTALMVQLGRVKIFTTGGEERWSNLRLQLLHILELRKTMHRHRGFPHLLPKFKVSLTLWMVKSSLAESELGRSSVMRNPDDWYHLSRECPALNLALVCFCKE